MSKSGRSKTLLDNLRSTMEAVKEEMEANCARRWQKTTKKKPLAGFFFLPLGAPLDCFLWTFCADEASICQWRALHGTKQLMVTAGTADWRSPTPELHPACDEKEEENEDEKKTYRHLVISRMQVLICRKLASTTTCVLHDALHGVWHRVLHGVYCWPSTSGENRTAANAQKEKKNATMACPVKYDVEVMAFTSFFCKDM